MVFARLFKGRHQQRPVEAVYEAVVEQARHPSFYTDFGVADRLEERFELLVLHVHLVVRRLSADGAGDRAQELFDALFHDMDRTLRAVGVGDMSVGKRVKDMVRAYYGRTGAYEAAIAGGDAAGLAAALSRNVYAGTPQGDSAARLTRYVLTTIDVLAAQPAADLAAGRIRFPDPRSST